MLADAILTDSRKEWICKFCSESNVWTRWRCRRCHTNIPAMLRGKHRQAVAARTRERPTGSSTSSGEEDRKFKSQEAEIEELRTRIEHYRNQIGEEVQGGQGLPLRRESGMEEEWRMDFEDEIESRKKLESKEVQDSLKNDLQWQLQEEQRRHDLMPEHQSKAEPVSGWCYQRQAGSMKALQRAVWSLIFLVFGVRMAKAEEPEIQAQKMSEKDLYQIPQVHLRWKRMHSWRTCEWKWVERALRKDEKEREKARVRTQVPLKDTAQELLKENSQERTQEPFREEAITMKGGEFRKRRTKESGRKEGRRGKKGKKRSVRKVHERDGGVRKGKSFVSA